MIYISNLLYDYLAKKFPLLIFNLKCYNVVLRKWNILRCYLCGQSGAHVKCLGRGYIPGIGYVCVDCNRVAKYTENKSIDNVYQPNMRKRLEEHKRRLQELTARDDPVLLASSVFGPKIWCKRFGIKECQVNVVNLDINIKRKIKISKIVDLIHASNSQLERILNKKVGSKSLPSKMIFFFDFQLLIKVM